jgi:hypothetical protein
VLSCPIGEALAAEFAVKLSAYHQTFISLIKTMTIAHATEQTRGLFEDCIAARRRLQDHERSHGCHLEIGKAREEQANSASNAA